MADDGRRDVRRARAVAAEFEHDDDDDLRLLSLPGRRDAGEPGVIELDSIDLASRLSRSRLACDDDSLDRRGGGGATGRKHVDHGLAEMLELIRGQVHDLRALDFSLRDP